MKKFDRRKKYVMVIDTETCPIDNTVEAVLPSNMLTYDTGWSICDKKGASLVERSYIIKDIFFKEWKKMQSSYYADKIPMYLEELAQGKRQLVTFREMRKQLLEDLEKYNVTEIYAHNMRFDYGTLNKTMEWVTKGKYRYFFPKKYIICDTLKMSRDVILKMSSYKAFSEKHGTLTKNGRLSASAENLYKYISYNPDFVESHTGLEDVQIEKMIYAYCIKQHKKMRTRLFEK